MDAILTEQTRSLLVEGERRGSQDSSSDELQHQSTLLKELMYKAASILHPAHLTTVAKRLGYSLVPQLVRSRVWDDHAPAVKQFPTSYLNGLRGITAIKVFTFHYAMAFTDFTFYPWGMDERHDRLIAMPILRYLYSGFTSHIFFGIAGYLTSLRLFQLLDKNDVSSHAKVLMSIAGSLFRRGFRLYLPVFIITLITATYIYLGFYEVDRPVFLDHEMLFPGEWNETKPMRYPTYGQQLGFWAEEMYQLTNVNSEETFYPLHDQHLWSILSEMRASLHLYGCLIAISQCKRHIRLFLLLVLAFLYFCWNRWEVWVYILGAAVAQVDLILTEKEEKKGQSQLSEKAITSRASGNNFTYRCLRFFGFFVALYLLSYPIFGDKGYARGYETLKLFIPKWMHRQDKFYSNIGTTLLLLLLVRSDPSTSKCRKILMSPVPQYLGTISFGMYLTHGPLMHVFGYMIPQHIWWTFGRQGIEVGDVAWFVPIFLGWAISLVVSLWVADVWTREVEGRCIKAVKWLEAVCFKEK